MEIKNCCFCFGPWGGSLLIAIGTLIWTTISIAGLIIIIDNKWDVTKVINILEITDEKDQIHFFLIFYYLATWLLLYSIIYKKPWTMIPWLVSEIVDLVFDVELFIRHVRNQSTLFKRLLINDNLTLTMTIFIIYYICRAYFVVVVYTYFKYLLKHPSATAMTLFPRSVNVINNGGVSPTGRRQELNRNQLTSNNIIIV